MTPDDGPGGESRREVPRNEVPSAVGLDVVLARTDEVCLFVSGLTAYSTGLSFNLEIRTRTGRPDPDGFPPSHSNTSPLLFGVEFADGRRCMNRHRPLPGPPRPAAIALPTDEEQPSLVSRSGSTGDCSAQEEYFLSPLPPPGNLRFVCVWPAMQVPEEATAVDAGPILQAAGRVQCLWSWQPEPVYADEGEWVPAPQWPEGWFTENF